ncbi:MAG: molybdate ABC transporter substrate-binding protein [Acidimicrobiales bacterium]
MTVTEADRSDRPRRRQRNVRRSLTITVAILLSLGFVASGCSSDTSSDTGVTGTTSGSPTAPVSGTITVSAAASLTGAFGTIKDDFVEAHPGANLTINFGSSGALETQIESGAPADVAAFADEATMEKLSDEDLLAAPAEIFATNQLIIITEPGNPKGIRSLADLATAGTVSLCADTAPCGKYANQVLQSAGVTIPTSSITLGQDVKATTTAVTEGDAVAGIVYVTDAQAAGSKVGTVEVPTAQNAVATYPLAVLKSTTSRELADAFMAYVLGPEGQAVLKAAGFEPAP